MRAEELAGLADELQHADDPFVAAGGEVVRAVAVDVAHDLPPGRGVVDGRVAAAGEIRLPVRGRLASFDVAVSRRVRRIGRCGRLRFHGFWRFVCVFG